MCFQSAAIPLAPTGSQAGYHTAQPGAAGIGVHKQAGVELIQINKAKTLQVDLMCSHLLSPLAFGLTVQMGIQVTSATEH